MYTLKWHIRIFSVNKIKIISTVLNLQISLWMIHFVLYKYARKMNMHNCMKYVKIRFLIYFLKILVITCAEQHFRNLTNIHILIWKYKVVIKSMSVMWLWKYKEIYRSKAWLTKASTCKSQLSPINKSDSLCFAKPIPAKRN